MDIEMETCRPYSADEVEKKGGELQECGYGSIHNLENGGVMTRPQGRASPWMIGIAGRNHT